MSSRGDIVILEAVPINTKSVHRIKVVVQNSFVLIYRYSALASEAELHQLTIGVKHEVTLICHKTVNSF